MTSSHILGTLRLPLLAALLLTGCMSDSASFLIGGDKNHTITVLRNQDWFWKDTANLHIVPTRLPECQESILVKDVPRAAPLNLYLGPDEYAEAIYILAIKDAYYALSTQTCKSQRFEEKPANPGTLIGVFKETDGRLGFEAAAEPAPASP